MLKQKPGAKAPARTVAYRGKIIEMDINESIKTGPLVEVQFLLKTGKSPQKKVQLRELVPRELFYICTLFYVFEIFIPNFCQKLKFCQTFKCLSRIEIFVKNRNF